MCVACTSASAWPLWFQWWSSLQSGSNTLVWPTALHVPLISLFHSPVQLTSGRVLLLLRQCPPFLLAFCNTMSSHTHTPTPHLTSPTTPSVAFPTGAETGGPTCTHWRAAKKQDLKRWWVHCVLPPSGCWHVLLKDASSGCLAKPLQAGAAARA